VVVGAGEQQEGRDLLRNLFDDREEQRIAAR